MALQLDNNLIAIRERNLPEILDLALSVLRTQGLPLVIALALGALPMALLNDWLLHDSIAFTYYESDALFEYVAQMLLLVAVEMPLAAAPATLYLGQSMFHEKTSLRQLLRDLVRSLPQMLVLQGALRGLCIGLFVLVIPPALPYVAWPYLSEIILLERNPLFARRHGRLTTLRRSRMLHFGSIGDLLARWLASAACGALLTVAVWMALWVVLSQLAGGWIETETSLRVLFPIGLWTVASYFAVVRFLSYLDLRIRREGWEVELALRAEAAQLAPVTAGASA